MFLDAFIDIAEIYKFGLNIPLVELLDNNKWYLIPMTIFYNYI